MQNSLRAKQELSRGLSLKMWLPLLQSSVQDIESHLMGYANDNPFIEVKSPSFPNPPSSQKSHYNAYESSSSYHSGEFIEELITAQVSLYDKLFEAIDAPLFPTPKSQKIALSIVEYINEYGYFDGDITQIALKHHVTDEFVESIRQRFSYLEPIGIGAINLEESFLFQLQDLEIDKELYVFVEKMIHNLSKMDRYTTHHRFNEARNIIKSFRNPPAIDYLEELPQIIPDFFVSVEDNIEIRMNNAMYPDVLVKEPFSSKNDSIKEKLKEARNLINLLNLRKSTLYKLILLIVEKQLSFFVGGELKPLTMQQIADELSFAESTISRAVSNKYIECSRGVFALKFFFTNMVEDDDLSSSQIKSFIKKLIEFENPLFPLTDEQLLEKINARFNLSMVRRSVTKYRLLEDIPSSKERKKIYKVCTA